jgi:uncharacterized protein
MLETRDPNETLDRVTPTLRPRGPAVMRQRWHHLLFLHFRVPEAALRPLLPPGLDLDTFEGSAWVGLTPFTMTGVRPSLTPPLPWLSAFHEVNVRTYVHRDGRDPGVWFFSLDAARAPAVLAARAGYRLPYHHARMRMAWRGSEVRPLFAFSSRRRWPGPTPAACDLAYAPDGPVREVTPGTLEYFLLERYVLYAGSARRLLKARVHHGPYPVQDAVVARFDESLLSAAGIARPDEPPLAHYARGVRVRVYPPRRV